MRSLPLLPENNIVHFLFADRQDTKVNQTQNLLPEALCLGVDPTVETSEEL